MKFAVLLLGQVANNGLCKIKFESVPAWRKRYYCAASDERSAAELRRIIKTSNAHGTTAVWLRCGDNVDRLHSCPPDAWGAIQ